MKNMLYIQNIEKIFKNKIGVKKISFNVGQGEIVGLIGENGVGKTTIIKLIFSELKRDGGLIKFNDAENEAVLKDIAFFPDHNNFPKNYKISEYSYYYAELKGIKLNEVKEKFEYLCDSFQLKEYINAKFSEVSAGTQKKFLLISILITNPKIIILDEPTANLDINSRVEFMEVLKFLAQEMSISIIITSHIIDELNDIVDKAVFIRKTNNIGRVIYCKKFDKNNENLKDIYMKIVKPQRKIEYEKIKQLFE